MTTKTDTEQERAEFEAWAEKRGVWPRLTHEEIFSAGYQAGRAALQSQDREDAPTQAARDVLTERQRQVEAEGWTPGHDDGHSHGELAAAAACYALYSGGCRNARALEYWPWGDAGWKPKDPRRNLVKAAALILAEIERLDRAAARAAKVE